MTDDCGCEELTPSTTTMSKVDSGGRGGARSTRPAPKSNRAPAQRPARPSKPAPRSKGEPARSKGTPARSNGSSGRRVRTPAGARLYGVPIGELIPTGEGSQGGRKSKRKPTGKKPREKAPRAPRPVKGNRNVKPSERAKPVRRYAVTGERAHPSVMRPPLMSLAARRMLGTEELNWVSDVGGLPRYIRRIADALMRRGMTESHAIASAVNNVKRWARGGDGVKADTVAKAIAAVAEWEAKKIAARATAAHVTTMRAQPTVERRAAARTALVASAGAVAASTALAAPVKPPRAWFANPGLRQVTPITVTAEGQVYGHLADWTTCHLEMRGRCTTAPRSRSGYAMFHLGALTTAEGDEISVGRLVAGTPHASLAWDMPETMVHYSDTGQVAADVRVGEDAYGIWVAGALRPDATPTQVRVLKASPLSGDWREDPRTGRYELVAALAVNAPGFPIPRPQAMVASVSAAAIGIGMVAPASSAGVRRSRSDQRFLQERTAEMRDWSDKVSAESRQHELQARAGRKA